MYFTQTYRKIEVCWTMFKKQPNAELKVLTDSYSALNSNRWQQITQLSIEQLSLRQYRVLYCTYKNIGTY